MHTSVLSFRARADVALTDPTLKLAIDRTTGTAERKRAAALAAFPQFDAARDRGKRIKDHVIEHFDHYLLEFERNAIASGAQVHWASTADEASRIVVDLCRKANAKRVTRVKSMLGEEIGLPHALDAAGIERVETDLAEHIVQLGGDRPSHIVWPSMHRTREQVSEMFKQSHRVPHREETIEAMVDSARRELRDKFLSADVSISGANFLLADTGATCTVTNEGNAELTTSPPRMHIVTAGIEKLVPSLPHAFALLRLLVRSATGADVTQYTTFHCGPKKPGDLDGPEEFHIVLVDNGRTKMLAEAGLREMLRCIRCGACMNHCVVFRQMGGHAYGGTYPGPMGAVLTPVFDGLEQTRDLPHACTLNGKCQEVCPVDIPLPTLLRGWRDRSWREGLEPAAMRFGMGIFTFVASRPRIYRLGASVAVRMLGLFGRSGWIRSMPGLGAWTAHRDFPAPEGRTFMARYASGEGQREVTARDDILGRVRAALGRHSIDAATVQHAAAALLTDLPSTRPDLLASSLVQAFIARVTSPKVAASAEQVASLADVPAAVAAYLEIRRLPAVVALQPHALLRSLDWSAFEVHAQVAPDESAAVGMAKWGIAETGSLVFHSGSDSPVLANFLPLHHIVLLRSADILAYLEDYAALIAGQPMPRNVNLITGASGTTDIEGSLVLGAHGPRYMHVVIADG